MTNSVKVSTMDDAIILAHNFIGSTELDAESSKRAGYPVWRSKSDMREYWCNLADRIEVNYANGNSTNIWIANEAEEKLKEAQRIQIELNNKIVARDYEIDELKSEIIKLKAKLYDMMCEVK